MDQVDILQLLFSTQGVDGALSFILDERHLRINEAEALKFAKVLIEDAFFAEARLIFEAAEPLAYLSGSKGVEITLGGENVLKAWVDIAHDFIKLEDIISTIKQTRYKQDDRPLADLDNDNLHFSIIQKLVSSIYSSKNKEKIENLISILGSKEELDDHLLNISFSICIGEFPSVEVRSAIERILN